MASHCHGDHAATGSFFTVSGQRGTAIILKYYNFAVISIG
jgi:hypothetical protein